MSLDTGAAQDGSGAFDGEPALSQESSTDSAAGAELSLQAAIMAFLKQHERLAFVQVGGFDGVSYDPIRPFIQGGRLAGLIIEPLPDAFAKLQALYTGHDGIQLANCAVTEGEERRPFWRFKPDAIEQGLLSFQFAGTNSLVMTDLLADQGSLGRLFTDQDRTLLRQLVETVDVRCRTFATVLEEHAIEHIDLLQVDAQGYDLVVLQSFDFDRYRPSLVNFKHVHLGPDDRRRAEALLRGRGYDLARGADDTLAFQGRAISSSAYSRVIRPETEVDGLQGNVIFCAWTGSNPLTPSRAEALLSIYKETGCPVLFLNGNTIAGWELPGRPFHPAYAFLSETHKADYLRCYLMHHVGGGYTDLKRTRQSWLPFFQLLRESSGALGLGYREIGPHGVAPCGEPLESELRRNSDKLIGNCAYIFKKRSALTQRWIDTVHDLLDRKLDLLRRAPARHPMDQTGVILPDGSVSAYPLRWAEMLGELFHPLVYEFSDRLIQAEIAPSFQNYR